MSLILQGSVFITAERCSAPPQETTHFILRQPELLARFENFFRLHHSVAPAVLSISLVQRVIDRAGVLKLLSTVLTFVIFHLDLNHLTADLDIFHILDRFQLSLFFAVWANA